jgi:hypothetical protein
LAGWDRLPSHVQVYSRGLEDAARCFLRAPFLVGRTACAEGSRMPCCRPSHMQCISGVRMFGKPVPWQRGGGGAYSGIVRGQYSGSAPTCGHCSPPLLTPPYEHTPATFSPPSPPTLSDHLYPSHVFPSSRSTPPPRWQRHPYGPHPPIPWSTRSQTPAGNGVHLDPIHPSLGPT